jgi:hypothetical protein
MQEGYKGIIDEEFPISDEIHNTTLSLPISFSHTSEQVIFISKMINLFQI